MFGKFIILISALIFSVANAQEFTDKSFTNKLTVQADRGDQTVRSLFDITKKINEFLAQKLTRIPGKSPNVTLKIEGTPPSTDTFKIIYFKRGELQEMSSLQIAERIMDSLIRRSLVSLGAKNNITAPPWLTAGLTYQFVVGETMSTEEKYPLTRLTVINNKYPDLDKLVKGQKPSTEHYWLYSIYAERSAVFHRGISSLKAGRQRLLDYLIDRKSKDIITDFSKHYDEFKSTRTRKKWFKASCFRVCFDVINPYPPDEINRRISDMLSVTVARPGNNGFGTMKVPLEELTEENSKFIDMNYLTFLERDMVELMLTSSETIRPALQYFILSLIVLKKGDREKFKENIKLSRKKFQEAIQRQIELNRYLDNLEKKHNQLNSDYRKIIYVEELASARNKKLFPELNKYLDELEKKLAEIKIE